MLNQQGQKKLLEILVDPQTTFVEHIHSFVSGDRTSVATTFITDELTNKLRTEVGIYKDNARVVEELSRIGINAKLCEHSSHTGVAPTLQMSAQDLFSACNRVGTDCGELEQKARDSERELAKMEDIAHEHGLLSDGARRFSRN